MNRQDQNAVYLAVASEAERVSQWQEFAIYCRLREQGLRKEAFVHLQAFLSEATRWEFSKQREFIFWLCAKIEKTCDTGVLYPNPLKTTLFAPFFDEWQRQEPSSDEANALRAQYLVEPNGYYRAIEINPHNQRARIALAENCLYDLWYATHHLPEFFIGSETEATKTAEEAKSHIGEIEDSDRRESLEMELRQHQQLLHDWIAFKEEGSDDFNAWCLRKGHRYPWVAAYYYA
ncbi:MAG: hypothetical protein ABFC96_05650 [Thermoguttaceae bacterium]